jgi:hypothetical protein
MKPTIRDLQEITLLIGENFGWNICRNLCKLGELNIILYSACKDHESKDLIYFEVWMLLIKSVNAFDTVHAACIKLIQ